ncbi:uncharacterized protein LOC126843599 isoform X2 [Adelges cooleyi]|nr:uncharacterized protein LOC126843599 isoform X2 [Adelges cooleyi]
MMFVYTSVHSLETGYKYTKTNIEKNELYMELKCGYLFGGCTQMRLVKDLLENHTELKAIVNYISSLNGIVRSQIISLFCLKVKRIGAMWALHLFTSLITAFYQDTKSSTEDHPKLIETISYVIEKLDDDLSGCRKGNLFDSYESHLRSGQKLEYFTYIKTILPQYMKQANAQLRRNKIISDGLLKDRLDLSIKSNSLLMSNLGIKDKLKYDLQNVYNLKITWNNTSPILCTAWGEARALDWKNTNLRHIKSYYNACNDFLKIILFRLTFKHMAYLRPYVGKLGRYKLYAQEWYNIVLQFVTIVNLSGDLNVLRLLHCLMDLINGVQIIDSVVSYVVSILVTLCQPFGCEASSPIVIDNQELKIKYTGLTEEEILSLKIPFSPVPIEYNSLGNARTFLSHLKLVFNNVNFSVIRSLTEYIDELNPINCVERSDASIVGLEHLHINMSDFEL